MLLLWLKCLKKENVEFGVVHAKLLESHDQLQIQLTKEQSKSSLIKFVDVPSSSNPCCDHANLVEENNKLKDQLAKGQIGKKGLGYVPKPKKKKNKKKGKAAIQVHEAENSGSSHNGFAGKYNPSYVLCRSKDGHVYAKFVGSPYEYVKWSIWAPKTLVANKRGTIEKWVPKIKN